MKFWNKSFFIDPISSPAVIDIKVYCISQNKRHEVSLFITLFFTFAKTKLEVFFVLLIAIVFSWCCSERTYWPFPVWKVIVADETKGVLTEWLNVMNEEIRVHNCKKSITVVDKKHPKKNHYNNLIFRVLQSTLLKKQWKIKWKTALIVLIVHVPLPVPRWGRWQ